MGIVLLPLVSAPFPRPCYLSMHPHHIAKSSVNDQPGTWPIYVHAALGLSVLRIFITNVTHKHVRRLVPAFEVTTCKSHDGFAWPGLWSDWLNVLLGDVAHGFVAHTGW